MADADVITESKSKGDGEDLSAEIVLAVARQPRELVTCRRITRDHYRCNWWASQDTASYDNPAMTGLMVTTNRICHSQFLHVTRGDGGLKIRVLSKGKNRD